MAPTGDLLRHFRATIITSTSIWPGEGGSASFALWLQAQRGFADIFRDGRLVRAEGSGHYVQREDPSLVAREIEAQLSRLRSD